METKGHAGLHFWMEAEPQRVIVHLEGDIDIATAPLLADAIAAAFRQRPGVIVDLAAVSYMNGSGLRVLEETAQAHAGHFAVARPNATIRRLFTILKLSDLVPIASLDGARDYLNNCN